MKSKLKTLHVYISNFHPPVSFNWNISMTTSSCEIFRKHLLLMCLFLSDGPSLVYVNVFVRSFSKIDDVKMVSTRNVPDLMIGDNLLSPVESRTDISSKTINEIFFYEYSFQITLQFQSMKLKMFLIRSTAFK